MSHILVAFSSRFYLIFIYALLTTSCTSSLYVEEISKGKYLVDIYNLPDNGEAENLRWQEITNEICKGKVHKDNVTYALEAHDGPICEGCSTYKKGTYTAWGTVECQLELNE